MSEAALAQFVKRLGYDDCMQFAPQGFSLHY